MGSEQEPKRSSSQQASNLYEIDPHSLSAPYESEDLTIFMDRTWLPVPIEQAHIVIARVFASSPEEQS